MIKSMFVNKNFKKFFFHCPNVRHLWYLFFQMWNGTEYHSVNFPNYPDVHDILFGIKNMNDGHEVLNIAYQILHLQTTALSW